MKNILAENMLRFGVKNLSESSRKKLQEQPGEVTASAVQPGTATPPSAVQPAATTTLESCWQDPALKNVSVTSAEMNQGITREAKFNNIIWANLINYYDNQLIGKNAIGWSNKFQWNSADLMLSGATGPMFNFTIQDIFKGKDHTLQYTTFTPGEKDCIFICSQKVQAKATDSGTVTGTLRIFDMSPDRTTTLDEFKLAGIPRGPHLRILGNNVYYFAGYEGSFSPSRIQLTPLANQTILSSLRSI